MQQFNPETNSIEKITHLLPEGSILEPVQLTILIPALNESITIGEFVDWCKQGIAAAGVTAQILIVDSSSDRTPEIALANGAEVLRVPKRGLGRAYVDAIPYARGEWIIMGDADLTYDFRELVPFITEFKKGAEFILGNRFGGGMQKGAMPRLHQYFGTPVTTWVFNRIYGSNYSDIHCGMRGVTRSALLEMDLKSQSWEYASEMILRASKLNLRVAEVPVKFYKDREGRQSHLKRGGFLTPWIAGWISLKVMFVYSPDTFLLKPGYVLLTVGLILSCLLSLGPHIILGIGFNLHWMLLGLTCTTLGYNCIQVAVIARAIQKIQRGFPSKIQKFFSYNRGMLLAAMLFFSGIVIAGKFVIWYFNHGLQLSELSYSAVFGLLLIILGFQSFSFVLMLEMIQHTIKKRNNIND